jgi:hypothetical protein
MRGGQAVAQSMITSWAYELAKPTVQDRLLLGIEARTVGEFDRSHLITAQGHQLAFTIVSAG